MNLTESTRIYWMNQDNWFKKPPECVLSGGGIKGLGHVGFLRAATERGVNFGDFYCTSIGALIGAFFTNGYSPDQIETIFLEELHRFGKSTFADTARRPNMDNIRQGGLVNLLPIFTEMVTRYNLRPQKNLKIVAARLEGMSFRPYVFQGCDYDLAVALTAACAMPPFISTVVIQEGEKNTRTRLMDGGLYHAAPYQLCQGPAIVSRLGIAERFPQEPFKMAPFDLLVHLSEQLASPVKNYRNRVKDRSHLVITTGDPRVATFAFGLSDQICRAMVAYGYEATVSALDSLLADGASVG